MTINWLQLTGGAMYGAQGPAFSGAAETRAMEALKQLEAELISLYDGSGGWRRAGTIGCPWTSSDFGWIDPEPFDGPR